MTSLRTLLNRSAARLVAVTCAVAVATSASPPLSAGVAQADAQADAQPIPAEQLDSLVAPIALYPDPLLAQTLAASTYPLELMQLQQWLTRNSGLKDKALADAVAKQPWDASVQAMAALPDLVKRLTDDIQWTTDLGNAFLAQQADVMDAVQRMRHKAQDKGTLTSSEQQVVKTEVVEQKSVVVIEQASPQTVYVPSYDPTIVYGPPAYPYPPIYYPPAGYYAAGAAISFGVGVAMGAAWGGGWGWNAGWGGNNITINNNNNFNRAANINGGNRVNGGNRWQHQPQHRGGAPYRDRATADRFGGTARGDSLANRQAGARQQLSRQGGNLRSNDGVGTSGISGRAGGIGDRNGIGDRGNLGNRNGFGDRTGGSIDRPGGGGDRIGQRDVPRGGGNQGAFGGGGRLNGDGARASSQRGSSSMGSRGGGMSRGGGGARRGGGGGRR